MLLMGNLTISMAMASIAMLVITVSGSWQVGYPSMELGYSPSGWIDTWSLLDLYTSCQYLWCMYIYIYIWSLVYVHILWISHVYPIIMPISSHVSHVFSTYDISTWSQRFFSHPMFGQATLRLGGSHWNRRWCRLPWILNAAIMTFW